ncbi:MAG: hypothetical protein IJP14_05650 [Clostridia bacterium]|nr:hypothetical protein [Clostridia bacterium]
MKPTSRVALGGILSALSLLILCLTIFPFATYALPPLAGIALIPLVIECGKKWAFLAYAAVSLLALLIVPDMEAKLLFVAFFGYYPIIKAVFESFHSRLLEWVTKLAVFNGAVVGAYLLLSLLGLPLDDFRIAGVALPLSAFLLAFLLMGNVIFVLYDLGVTRSLPLYFVRIRPIVMRLFKI